MATSGATNKVGRHCRASEPAICNVEESKSKMICVLRKLLTSFVLMAVAASASAAETNLCSVNCALAGVGHFQHQRMHHSQQGEMGNSSMSMPMETHENKDMDMGANSAGSESLIRSRRCAAYGEPLVLAAGSKFVLTENVGPTLSVATTYISASFTSVFNVANPSDSSPPLAAGQNISTPIRI